MAILHDLWSDEVKNLEIQTMYEYVLNLIPSLEETCKMAQEALKKSAKRYKFYYDKGKRDCVFKAWDKVLLLLPTDNNKLLMQWKGPHKVIEKRGQSDYVISLPTGKKTFHANILKKYITQENDKESCTRRHHRNVLDTALLGKEEDEVTAFAVVEESDEDDDENQDEVIDGYVRGESLPTFSALQTEIYKDVTISPHLSPEQKQEVEQLLYEFQDILTDVPKETSLIQHEINLTTDDPVRCRPYKIPFAKRKGY